MLGELETQLAWIYCTGIETSYDHYTAEKEFKIISSIARVHIDKPVLEFGDYLQKKRFYVILL